MNILLFYPDGQIRQRLLQLLQQNEAFQVFIANNPEKASQIMDAEKMDVIISEDNPHDDAIRGADFSLVVQGTRKWSSPYIILVHVHKKPRTNAANKHVGWSVHAPDKVMESIQELCPRAPAIAA